MSTPHTSTSASTAGASPSAVELRNVRDAWRDACEDLRLAHIAWRIAPPGKSAEAYWVLVAAADREEAAAEVLRRTMEGEAA
jgi:hypothetical protein